MGRPRIHDERTREALLQASASLLAEHGAAALNLRRLARAVGASTQAIYTLFGSKQGLVRALHRAGFEALDHHLASVEPTDDPVAHICALALAYRSSALAQPHLYDVMFACPFPEFEPTAEDESFALSTLGRLRAAVIHHAENGAFGGRDPDQLTLQLWALAHGLASLELQGALTGYHDVMAAGAVAAPEMEQTWRSAFHAMLTGV
ncbi:MAG TPA: TetR/AcrR family transcriptional regulator [Euzebya sp.]|nr:TetR/AcrR family transcriptional regulator [Euzebya sp.]